MPGRSADSGAGGAIALGSTIASPGVLTPKPTNTMLKGRATTKVDVNYEARSRGHRRWMNVERLTDEFMRMMI